MKKLSYILLFLLVTMTPFVQAQPEMININTADAKALVQLKGVGMKYAERIVQYREANGSFSSGEAIQNVRGVGAKIYEMNRDRIVVADPTTE